MVDNILKTCAAVAITAMLVIVALSISQNGCRHAEAQGQPQFRDIAAAAQVLDHRSLEVAEWLQSILSQSQIGEFETRFMPEPSDTERRSALEHARRSLLVQGVALDDPVISVIDIEITKVPEPIPEPIPEPLEK